jgi:hypothetical protein
MNRREFIKESFGLAACLAVPASLLGEKPMLKEYQETWTGIGARVDGFIVGRKKVRFVSDPEQYGVIVIDSAIKPKHFMAIG